MKSFNIEKFISDLHNHILNTNHSISCESNVYKSLELRKIFYTKSMQTLATVHEPFYHLQYIYTNTLQYIRTFSSLPKTPRQDLELN